MKLCEFSQEIFVALVATLHDQTEGTSRLFDLLLRRGVQDIPDIYKILRTPFVVPGQYLHRE